MSDPHEEPDRDRSRRAEDEPGTIIFDLDGVVYLGNDAIRGAADTINELTGRGWQVLYATNNSTKSPSAVADVLSDRVGVEADPSSIVTSAMAAATYLVGHGLTSALVVGSEQLRATLSGSGIEVVRSGQSPDAVVVGLDRSLTYDTICDAATCIRAGARFVATNMDATLPTQRGPVPGAGTIVAAVQAASGHEPVACGKPNQPMVDLVQHLVRARHTRITGDVWMVGDRPESDIAFAKQAGWRSILTLSGVTTDPDSVPDVFAADHVIASLADLGTILHDDVAQAPAHER